jgi:hypothetical protein
MGGEVIGLTTDLTGDVQSVSADAQIEETTKEPYYIAQVVIDRSSLRPELLQRLVPGMISCVGVLRNAVPRRKLIRTRILSAAVPRM